MIFYALKTLIALLLIIAAGKNAKRPCSGVQVATVPIVSVMAMVWM